MFEKAKSLLYYLILKFSRFAETAQHTTEDVKKGPRVVTGPFSALTCYKNASQLIAVFTVIGPPLLATQNEAFVVTFAPPFRRWTS